MQKLEIKLLGTPHIQLGDDALHTFVTRKAEALLLYLAVTKGPHPRSSIASFFWRDVSDAQANNSLRRILPNLRKLVGDHLVIDRREVGFAQESSYWLDVDTFENRLHSLHGDALLQQDEVAALERTIELYRGDFLDGFHVRDAPSFEEWMLFQREHLRELAIHGLSKLAHSYSLQGNFARGLSATNRLLALEPWYEQAHRLQMGFLVQSGQRSAALAQYKLCQEMLADEFGAQPSPETVALYEQIKAGIQEPSEPVQKILSPVGNSAVATEHVHATSLVDVREIPRPTSFFGRELELSQLMHWLTVDRCALVAVLGTGGTGKTTLAAQLARQLVNGQELPSTTTTSKGGRESFERVIWRSLLNAPPLSAMVRTLLHALSAEPLPGLPNSSIEQLMILFEYLRQHRCLLILDNVESILKDEGYAGEFRTGYEEYGLLFRRMGELDHKSCLLLTSRELPLDVGRMARDYTEVRTLSLAGLPTASGVEVLQSVGLEDEPERMAELVRCYSGNPLALKVVAETILELYGDIHTFLQSDLPIFDDIRTVLDQQFARLSPLEQEMMVWLAIEREPLTAPALAQNWAYAPKMPKVVAALRSLQRRSLIDQHVLSGASGDAVYFTLQNVVMEYVTEQLIHSLYAELTAHSGTNDEAADADFCPHSWINRFTLLKAQSKEHVRNAQMRLILQPLLERLLATWGKEGVLRHMRTVLQQLHAAPPRLPGYASANLLHLLLSLEADLATWDFSNVTIRQADLRQAKLSGVQMAGADLTDSAFLDTFSAVLSVACSHHGTQLAAATTAGEVTLWHLNTLQPQFVCQAGTSWVRSVAFSPQDDLLAAGSADHAIYLFDAQTGYPVTVLHGHSGEVRDLTFGPDGRLLASAGMDGTVRLWDVVRGELLQTLRRDREFVMAVAFNGDGTLLASGGGDRIISLWDSASFCQVGTLEGHDGAVTSLAFSQDGQTLVSGSADQTIGLWNVAEMQLQQTLRGHAGEVESVAIHPREQLLATGCQNGEVRMWDLATGQRRATISAHAATVWSLSFTPGGETLVSGSNDYTIRLWDARSGDPLQTLRGYNDQVWGLVRIPQARRVVSGSGSGQLRIWDTETGRLTRQWRAHDGAIRGLAVSPQGALLASGGSDRTIRIWDVATGQLRHTLTGHLQRIFSLSFAPTGDLLASCSGDGTIRLWWTRTGQLHQALDAHRGRVSTIAFSPDGQTLVSCGYDQRVYLWDVQDDGTLQHRCALPYEGGFAYHLAFSPDGQYLSITSNTTSEVQLWNVERRQLVHTLQGQHKMSVDCTAFSPEGNRVATAGVDRTICLWDVATGHLLRRLTGHTAAVRVLQWLDAETLVSCSGDESIRIWQTERGDCLHSLHTKGPYAGMDITSVTGISDAQRQALLTLGAVDRASATEAS